MEKIDYDSLTDIQQDIVKYILRKTSKGTRFFFKCRNVSEDLGLSSRQIGSNLANIYERRPYEKAFISKSQKDNVVIKPYSSSIVTTWVAERLREIPTSLTENL